MLRTLILIALVVIAGLLIWAAGQPRTFKVQREAVIQAPPEKIIGFINDFRRWEAWSPFENLDPGMKKTYSGPAQGRGAVYAWAGNRKAGEGRMEIVDEVPASKVVIQLNFIKPMTARNMTTFSLIPEGPVTRVSWSMQGSSPFWARVLTLFVSMDKMIGKDFETGLANLKAVAEK